MGKKLYCGNLSFNVTSSDLDQLFSQFGTVQSAEVINDRDTGRSKGFGFVEMGSDAEAQAAIEGINGTEHDAAAVVAAATVVAAVAVAVMVVAAVAAAAAVINRVADVRWARIETQALPCNSHGSVFLCAWVSSSRSQIERRAKPPSDGWQRI